MQVIRHVSDTHKVLLRDGKPVGKCMYYWHSRRWLVHWANPPCKRRGLTYSVDTSKSYDSAVDALEALAQGYHSFSDRSIVCRA